MLSFRSVAVIGAGAWGTALAGVAIRMMSAPAADAISSVTPMLAFNRTPDNFGFARVAAISAARSGLRAKSTTSRPARAATAASAVPQAPAPITATDLKDGIAWPQVRSLAPLLRGEVRLRSRNESSFMENL